MISTDFEFPVHQKDLQPGDVFVSDDHDGQILSLLVMNDGERYGLILDRTVERKGSRMIELQHIDGFANVVRRVGASLSFGPIGDMKFGVVGDDNARATHGALRHTSEGYLHIACQDRMAGAVAWYDVRTGLKVPKWPEAYVIYSAWSLRRAESRSISGWVEVALCKG